MIELDLVVPEHKKTPFMVHNASGKFESAFLALNIPANNSIMLKSLEGMTLGVWVAHGEGKFTLPMNKEDYNISASFSHSTYPGNPNGSDLDVAALCSADGRHLAMMPHMERSYMPWQCGYYPEDRRNDDATPWLEAFVNARNWIGNSR
jgi:phosphoribosylformylglycinamidine synthase